MNNEKRDISGTVIPPYRMAQLVKVSSKITDTMVTGIWGLTYQEMDVVLDIVRAAIEGSREHVSGNNKA